jgi:hypothetical protein
MTEFTSSETPLVDHVIARYAMPSQKHAANAGAIGALGERRRRYRRTRRGSFFSRIEHLHVFIARPKQNEHDRHNEYDGWCWNEIKMREDRLAERWISGACANTCPVTRIRII